MADPRLLNTIRLYDEMLTCPCPGAPNSCPGCVAKAEQVSKFVNKWLPETLGDLNAHPERVCEFYNLINQAHKIAHLLESWDQ